MATRATYIGANSAQFAFGTPGHVSDVTPRRVWFSLGADGSDGCYVHPSDVADASQMDRAREWCGEHGRDTDEQVWIAASEIVLLDLDADSADRY